MTDDVARTIAGRYEIVRAIGRGAFGHTLLARDRTTDRNVALKVLDRRGDVDLKALELFEREAAVLRSMRHRGIPEIFDVVRDEWDGAPAAFLVMEYVEGRSLAEVIDAHESLDPADVMHLLLELLGILEYMHTRVPPIVHRDIKPANIIVRADGGPALVDFGSVRRVFLGADEAGSTIVGTYGYMPYEQYMGQATPASDLYSLAATFLQLLTGRPPRAFMTDEGRIEVPETLPGDSRLRGVIAKLLRPSPAERFASASDVRRALLATMALEPAGQPRRKPVRPLDPLPDIGPAPRQIQGATKELLNRIAPSALELMDSSAKPRDEPGMSDYITLAFFSLLTAGILPAVFIAMARARRRRLRPFLRDGIPATAEIIGIEQDKTAFEQKISKVTYEFEVDGVLYRDTDPILPIVANRWQPGDQIRILYLPHFDFDSVIISAS